MNFAIEKGFPWNKVALVVAFADKLIDQIKGKKILKCSSIIYKNSVFR